MQPYLRYATKHNGQYEEIESTALGVCVMGKLNKTNHAEKGHFKTLNETAKWDGKTTALQRTAEQTIDCIAFDYNVKLYKKIYIHI